MKASLLLSGFAALGLFTMTSTAAVAQQQVADADRVDRYRLYIIDGDQSVFEHDRMFLLDSQTGAVYRRVGSGERWAPFTKAHAISLFPRGGTWQEPTFELALGSSEDATSRLLLTNVASGARYTRNPDTGEWIPFRRN